MKYCITFLSFFAIIIVNSQSFNLKNYQYEAIYDFVSVPDTLKAETTKQQMVLYINNDESLYQNLFNKSIDSMSQVKVSTGDMSYIDLNKIKIPKNYFSVYKKYNDDKMIFTDRIGTAYVGYTDIFDDLKWEITNEKKKILIYNATKATLNFRGRQYVAWFTSEIPFQDGPYKFSKLPGLILELYDSKKYFQFTLLSFKNIENKVYYNTKYVDIDRKKYYEKKVDYHNSLLSNPIHKGKVKRIDSYNPIELK